MAVDADRSARLFAVGTGHAIATGHRIVEVVALARTAVLTIRAGALTGVFVTDLAAMTVVVGGTARKAGPGTGITVRETGTFLFGTLETRGLTLTEFADLTVVAATSALAAMQGVVVDIDAVVSTVLESDVAVRLDRCRFEVGKFGRLIGVLLLLGIVA